jgi:hypothetical protein
MVKVDQYMDIFDLRLPEGKPVELHLKLSRRKPLDWAARVA